MKDKREARSIALCVLLIAFSVTSAGCYIFTPASRIPKPAAFNCLWSNKNEGRIKDLNISPERIYGMGLTYAGHLKETGSEFDPDKPPPVFMKSLISLNKTQEDVLMPAKDDIINQAEKVEPGIGDEIDKKIKNFSPLLDYEGELAFVILEDIDWAGIEKTDYAPKLGYFLANDISARSLAVLGEGRKNKYDYWGASKSFQGFLPVSRKMWIPDKHAANSILCIDITTTVNGVVKQSSNTSDIMYTPREMLFYIAKRYPDNLPEKGDIVLTGTPPGVALQVSAWKSWLANAFRLDRFTKLIFAILTGERSKRFLKPGDNVVVSGGILGKIETKIVGSQI